MPRYGVTLHIDVDEEFKKENGAEGLDDIEYIESELHWLHDSFAGVEWSEIAPVEDR